MSRRDKKRNKQNQAGEAAVEAVAAETAPVEENPEAAAEAEVEAIEPVEAVESDGGEAATTPEAEAPEAEVPEVEESVVVEAYGIEEAQGGDETAKARLRALVEAAVYITDEPLQPAQIAGALGYSVEQVQKVLTEIVADFAQPHHGLAVRELAGGYQMATKAEHHEDLRQFVKKLQPPFKLSLAALETLAVIAYKQPVTAPEILEIRGVQGAGVLKTLLDRKLVQVSGRKQVIGKPALYKTTKEFLVQFGLKDLSELPTLKEFEELSRLALGEDEGSDQLADVEVENTEAPAETSAQLPLQAEGDEPQAPAETPAETATSEPSGEPAADEQTDDQAAAAEALAAVVEPATIETEG